MAILSNGHGNDLSYRILFLGENWYGSCARACAYALRRMGHDVTDVDAQTFFPRLRAMSSRVALRLAERRLIREYNNEILDKANHIRPDLMLAFKGTFVQPETLKNLRTKGVALYNYYPDRIALAPRVFLEKTVDQYDCLFDTKSTWDSNLNGRVRPRKRLFLPHGYDPQVHRLLKLDQRDIEQFDCDVSLVATHTIRKEKMLRGLVALRPNIRLCVWGNLWDVNAAESLSRYLSGPALEGDLYTKALMATKINLAIMGVRPGIEDETTTRTYEIPACGGFMLHERTPEVLELFEEGKEMACFGSVEELAEKVDYYLAHPEERHAIAEAGHTRCVPAYSYDNRMAEIIRWHEEHFRS